MGNKLNLELLLRDLYEAMSELSCVLDAEHKALEAEDTEQLQEAAVTKEELSQRIELLEDNRCSMLVNNQLANDLDSMRQLIQNSSKHDEDALFKLWNMIAVLTQECMVKNKLNGIIIESKRRYTDTALSILHGNLPGSTELYDAEGTTVPARNKTTIARA